MSTERNNFLYAKNNISKWSESLIETFNKYIRVFKSGVSARASQSSHKENIQGVFTRMSDMTHPVFWTSSKQVTSTDQVILGPFSPHSKDLRLNFSPHSV